MQILLHLSFSLLQFMIKDKKNSACQTTNRTIGKMVIRALDGNAQVSITLGRGPIYTREISEWLAV